MRIIVRATRGGTWLSLIVAIALALPTAGRAAAVQTFPIPTAASGLAHIAAGPDGALWFTEQAAGQVGRISVSGKITEYPIPNNASGLPNTGPDQIVASGGALWSLSDIGESAYRVATDGSYTQVYFNQLWNAADLAPTDTGGVWLMMAHGDGNDQDGDALVRVDPDGATTDYPATHPNHLYAIALAPDGSVWWGNAGSYLYRLTDAGSQLSYPLSSSAASEVSSIAFAPGGTPWFTEFVPNTLTGAGCCGAIGELAGGVAHITPIGAQAAVTGIEPHSLTVGPDGALWFAFSKTWSGDTSGFDGIGRIDPATGAVQMADLDPYVADDIAFGSDGALWFVDSDANLVGRVPLNQSLFPAQSGGPTPVVTAGGGGATLKAPAITLVLPAARIAAVSRTGTLRIGCGLAAAGRCSITATITAAVAHRLGLKVPHGAKSVSVAHGSAQLKKRGRATITLRITGRVRRAFDRAKGNIRLTLTAVSTAPGTEPVSVTRTLIVRRG